MVARLQTWFARQTLTVKLLVTVPLLAAAVLWSLVPESSGPAVDPGNRPVLPAATVPAGAAAAGAPGGSGAAATPAAQSAQGAPAAQATIATHQEPRPADSGFGLGTAVRTIVSLGLVLGLFVLCAKGLKHVMANAAQTPLTSANLRVAETTFVPNPSGKGRSALHLIEVGDRLLLVGATDQQMALLAEFEDDGGHRLRLKSSSAAAAESAGSTAAGSPNGVAQPVRAPRFEEALAEASEKGPRAQSAREPELAQMLARLRQTRQRLEEGV